MSERWTNVRDWFIDALWALESAEAGLVTLHRDTGEHAQMLANLRAYIVQIRRLKDESEFQRDLEERDDRIAGR